jgi:small-conductance mechanosensitive channel
VSKIFEYDDAFSQGVDLFKTYSVIVSFIYSRIVTNVQFMLMMLWERPFNIGDLLLVGDHIFSIVDFTTSHTELLGPYNMLITNDYLVKDRVSNLTKCNFIDYFDIEIPHMAKLNEKRVWRALAESYIHEFPRDILKDSVYCTWVRGNGGGQDAVILRSYWKYKFPVLDRSRLVHTQARIRTHLVGTVRDELRQASVTIQAASGGAYNEHPSIKKYADKFD